MVRQRPARNFRSRCFAPNHKKRGPCRIQHDPQVVESRST